MKTMRRMQGCALTVTLVALAGCWAGERSDTVEPDGFTDETTDPTPASELTEADVADGVLPTEGPWTVETPGGARVTLEAESALRPGMVSFSVHVVTGTPERRIRSAFSVDLASPTMPMHGVVRFPVRDGRAEIEVPMEGRWAIYVNLDEQGAEAAEFLFDVPAGATGGHMHHGGAP